MLKIDRDAKKFTRLQKPNMSKVGLTERYDLQHMIKNSPDAFFQEMGESLLLIGEEVRPTDFVEDRIDLLAVDQQGSLVVVELKRGSHKLQLLQALSYASMISKWEHSEIIAQRQQFSRQSEEDVEEEIEQFLLQDVANLNDSQRIIMVAEDFDYEVLVTSEWLSEIYNVDIRCFRLALSAEGKTEFLTCTCIYPPPEITKHAIKRGRKGTTTTKWSNWDDAMKAVANKAIVEFYKRELDAERENSLRKRILFYRFAGRRRFFVAARKKTAYVWQYRRFPDDEIYWNKKIGEHIGVKPVREGKALRFFLSKAKDFEQFINAINGDLQKVEFTEELFESNDEEKEDN
ncbi:MAG: hypothetical protein WAV28_09235 [Sedimentisphaerales bacterium]